MSVNSSYSSWQKRPINRDYTRRKWNYWTVHGSDHSSDWKRLGSGGIYGTGCNFEGGGVRVSLGKITKIRACPHPVPYMPPDPATWPIQIFAG